MTDRIKKLDERAAEFIQREISERLSDLSLELGVDIKFRRIKSDGALKLEIDISVVDDDGVVQTHEVMAFNRHAMSWGLDASDLHRPIKYNGVTYQIVGAKPQYPKYPILCKRLSDGKVFKLSSEQVHTALGTFRTKS